jgi:hypothetical protein
MGDALQYMAIVYNSLGLLTRPDASRLEKNVEFRVGKNARGQRFCQGFLDMSWWAPFARSACKTGDEEMIYLTRLRNQQQDTPRALNRYCTFTIVSDWIIRKEAEKRRGGIEAHKLYTFTMAEATYISKYMHTTHVSSRPHKHDDRL